MRISDWSSDVCSSDLGNNIPPLFDEVILAGADEDDDTLQCGYKIGPLLRGCRRVTVYYNHQDLSLKASDYAMGNPDRLGRSGPCLTPQCPDKVSVVHVSTKIIWEMKGPNAWTCDPTGHQYFRNKPRVRPATSAPLGGQQEHTHHPDTEQRR